jgi:hypothetical protein
VEHYIFLSYLWLDLNTAKGHENELDKTTIRRSQRNANSISKLGTNFHTVISNNYIYFYFPLIVGNTELRRLIKSEPIPQLLLWAFMACSRVNVLFAW